jgi:hypothetical protein
LHEVLRCALFRVSSVVMTDSSFDTSKLIEEILTRLLQDEYFQHELHSAGGLRIELTDQQGLDRSWGLLIPKQEMMVRFSGAFAVAGAGPYLAATSTVLRSMLDGSGNFQASVLRGEISLSGESELIQGLWRLNA